ncbi:uncharacterized protein LOC112905446 [Agrilus planipennis]|uniref:Uncharacterized protein LOC112905446 n=1 Tax=Agrilus planipennis TaxID=224129 RepID=A0A7F5RCK2_AGRPL|nr:uncharacterized protein LOC112905446 [Agrilus planipennis]
MKKTSKILNLPITHQYYWTDSTIVLSWLSEISGNWKTFVSNRISEIQSLTDVNYWRHVPTKYNPADLISRGTTTSDLINNKLWWNGPVWLKSDTTNWPITPPNIYQKTDVERKRVVFLIITVQELHVFGKFSNYLKLQRVIAYSLRFINNIKNKTNKLYGNISTNELERASLTIIKHIQAITFPSEISNLQSNKPLDRKSKLLPLAPFLDNNGLLRVGGRLKHAELDFSIKHPAILPSNHHVTKLLVQYEHEKLLHGGQQLTLASLRQQYWPINGRSIVRQVLHKCLRCFRTNPKGTVPPTMGNLPVKRLQTAPALNKILTQNRVLLLWIPGFSDITGNELANDLTNAGAQQQLTRPEPAVGICNSLNGALQDWETHHR